MDNNLNDKLEIINQLKINLDNWIHQCEIASGKIHEIGEGRVSDNFEGQATAYSAVKTFLEVNNL